MREIEEMRKRIEAAEGPRARSPRAGDAFTLIEQACRACERGSGELLVRVRCHGGGGARQDRGRGAAAAGGWPKSGHRPRGTCWR